MRRGTGAAPPLLAALALPAAGAARAGALRAALQAALDSVTRELPYAVQLGWKSEGADFALASGNYTRPGGEVRHATVDDTFCFGSGIKPFTAAAVVRLAESGRIGLDDPAETHIDPVLRAMNGTSMRRLFGANASQVTVRHLLQMRSGIADYDWPEFDLGVLLNRSHARHDPMEFVAYAAAQRPRMVCAPGTCVCYSSTNYILAGMVLLAHSPRGAGAGWATLDQTAHLPAAVVRDDMRSCRFLDTGAVSAAQSLPGYTGGGFSGSPAVTIYGQSASITGWTCGNLFGTAMDVARFYWDLVGPRARVVSPASLAAMKEMRPLSVGWGVGEFQYGTGLMIQSLQMNRTRPPQPGEWGSYLGHGGETFGFTSFQGVWYNLNASISVISNEDSVGASYLATCRVVQAAAWALRRERIDLGC